MTRFEEVDDVEHEKSEKKRKQEEEERFGERKTTRKQDPRPHEVKHVPFRSGVRTVHQGRGGERRTVAKQLKNRDKSLKSYWTTCSWVDEKEWKTLSFWVARERAHGFVEG